MKKPNLRKRILLLLITLSLLIITSCNYPGKNKGDDPNIPASTPILLETNSFTENSVQTSRIETFTLTIPQLENRQRKIQVYLPPNYDLSDLSYPVIYFFDGDSLFNPPPNAVGDWLVDETLDELYDKNLTEGIIVVAIAYDPAYRWSEYMPWINPNMHDWVKTKNSNPTEGGEGAAFLNFIVSTLKPEVDSRYRTLSDKGNTMIGGPCRMGMIPLYAGLSRPDVFSKVMVMSPAVWLAEAGGAWLSNNQLIDFIEEAKVPADLRIYIDIGTEESSGDRPKVYDQDGKRITYPQAYLEGAEQLYLPLLSQGIPEDNLQFEIIEGAAGTRDEWAKRFDEAILWMMEEDYK